MSASEGVTRTQRAVGGDQLGHLAGSRRLALLGSSKRDKPVARKFIERFRIRAINPMVKVKELSGGNQRKVALAKSLTHMPRVVIFDEPTRGVDVGSIEEIHQLIREFADAGCAVVLISSYLPEIFALSDRILVARSGRVVPSSTRRRPAREMCRSPPYSEKESRAETHDEIVSVVDNPLEEVQNVVI